MLAPRDTATRQRKSLDGLWRFSLDAAGVGRSERWWEGLGDGAREIPVPSSYNDIFPEAAAHDHVGDAWYETVVRVPRAWAQERIVLRFGSATHRAVVWVNGVQVVEHEGGYTPFEADVSDVVDVDVDNRVTVAVNNVLTWHTIPPGLINQPAGGGWHQQLFYDFYNYAGLHRTVWLYTTPRSYIDDVTVVTGLNGSSGIVHYWVATGGEGDFVVAARLCDAGGGEVASATGTAGELDVEDVRPWQPGEGYLYDLIVELRGADNGLLDTYSLPIGIRSVRIDGPRFLVNERPFYFRGFGKHEDAAVRGKAHDNVFMVHDFALLEWLGANSFRTSHYPYAEEVLEYADRHGVVVSMRRPRWGSTAA